MISLIHPSRGRPQKASQTWANWQAKSSNKEGIQLQHILSLDENDPTLEDYISIFGMSGTKIIINDNTCVVEAANHAAKFATGEILIYLSDDFDCPEDWDLLISNKFLSSKKPELIKVDDCLQPFDIAVLTIPIMNMALYLNLGYMFYPEYKSMFCDEDLYWTCKNNGWIIYASELKFPHLHCCIGKAENDETYKRSAANWDQGKELFAKRKALNFPI